MLYVSIHVLMNILSSEYVICIYPCSDEYLVFICVAGMQTITERLEKPSDTIPDMFLSVSLNKPLMSEDQKKSLNPLVVKVHSATNMPQTPILYDDLRMR